MNQLAGIEAEITFLPESEGGRKELPAHLFWGGAYRPHLVAGDPNQRRAIVIGNEIQETYLGVVFMSSPEKIEAGESFTAELALMYWPHPVYDSLVPGASFTIREGAQIVGFGHVKKIIELSI